MNQLIGYYDNYITGNYVDQILYRILGFKEYYGQNYPESGTLFSISFNYLNSLENNIEHDNLMFSDNQGELVYSLINLPILNNLAFADIDGNGKLDIRDLTILQYYILDELNIGRAQNEIADVNMSGYIDIIDMVIILQNLLM